MPNYPAQLPQYDDCFSINWRSTNIFIDAMTDGTYRMIVDSSGQMSNKLKEKLKDTNFEVSPGIPDPTWYQRMLSTNGNYPDRLTISSKNIMSLYNHFPIATKHYINDVMHQRFADNKNFTPNEIKYQESLLEELINNELMLWNCCYNIHAYFTHYQLKEILTRVSSATDGSNTLIHKAAESMNNHFFMFLINCRHAASFNLDAFTVQMQLACTRMLKNPDYSDNFKAQKISGFLTMIDGHYKGFRKDLSVFFKKEIGKHCVENPSFASFIDRKYIIMPKQTAFTSTTSGLESSSRPLQFSGERLSHQRKDNLVPLAEVVEDLPSAPDHEERSDQESRNSQGSTCRIM